MLPGGAQQHNQHPPPFWDRNDRGFAPTGAGAPSSFGPSPCLIHASAWKEDPANFVLTEFSEVHARLWGSGFRRTFKVRPYLRTRTKEIRERVLFPLVAAFGVPGRQRPCSLSPARAYPGWRLPMGSLSSDGCPSPGGARSDGGRGDRTLDDSLCAIGGTAHASPRRHGCRDHFSRARDSIHDEYSAVRAPYCNAFCSVHSIAYSFAYCITYSFAYCIAYCFLLGIAVPLGGGRARLLESSRNFAFPEF